MNSTKRVFAKFSGSEIFLEQGRLLFSLLHIFSTAGYQIKLFNNLRDKQLDKYGQLVYSLGGLELVDATPASSEGWLYLYDKEERAINRRPWVKKVQVRFDMFAPFWFSSPMIMPFPMHPLQANIRTEQLEECRSASRKMRVFFSGDTHQYRRTWVHYPSTKLPRLPIVNAVMEGLGDALRVISDPKALDELRNCVYSKKCVITASSEVRIEPQDWLSTLAMADFFLSPPGIVMPMCHNIIEAMAVGTIPITNYPEWLDPHLTHMENCIVFDDRDDLIAEMKQVLEMAPEEIARLRSNVIDYYHTYLRPETFIRRVEASADREVPILMYTERNMARNPSKLGRHSILMQGTTVEREKNGFRRLLSSLRS
jgi:hypothetical protein